jgi:uncharacterized protein
MRQSLPLGLRRAFVDTSAYFAMMVPRDANHQQAVGIMTQLANQRWQLFTTNYILAETHALLINRVGYTTALSFLRETNESSTRVIHATVADERRAREIMERYADKDFSLVDAISFSVMERLNIRSAFMFDHHFAQYGFVALAPEVT